MYSDDIWNLVITSKSNNSKKSNKTPTDEQINKLKERNKKLLSFLKEDTYISEIKLAMEETLIERYYIDIKSQ